MTESHMRVVQLHAMTSIDTESRTATLQTGMPGTRAEQLLGEPGAGALRTLIQDGPVPNMVRLCDESSTRSGCSTPAS